MSIDKIYEQLTELTLTVDLLEQIIVQKEEEALQAVWQGRRETCKAAALALLAKRNAARRC